MFHKLKSVIMITIIAVMFIGIGIGYLFRDLQILQKVEKGISITIFLLLFVLGVSVGSNNLIINDFWKLGWQAAILASFGTIGSISVALLMFHLFFKEGGKK